MKSSSQQLEKLADIDRRLVGLASGLKLLTRLSWPESVEETFLADWHAGKRSLPIVNYQPEPMTERIAQLRELDTELDRVHPMGQFLSETVRSYITVCRLLENIGSPRMTPYSLELYGRPGDSLAGGRVTNLDAASHFLDVAREYTRANEFDEDDYCLPASTLQADMSARIGEVITDHPIKVIVDPTLVSKAAAGATRIRLRDATCFTEADLEQLLQHEAFVHSLTALNGQDQPHFSSMGLGAPRTTATQEGLATFAELVTGSIDITRLARIAHRIVAIDMALNGADFLQVFEYFLSLNQPEGESFASAMRVFRGAPVTGGSAFTKDVVYVHGLMEVHTFFRWCIQHHKLGLARHLFAGRLTIGDVVRLEEAFEEGWVAPPRYLPPWMVKRNALTAYLAFAVFANQIHISELDEGYRFDEIDEMGI